MYDRGQGEEQNQNIVASILNNIPSDSEITKIEPSNISLIFRNKNQPSLDYFLRIWIALGCPPISDCLYREIAEK